MKTHGNNALSSTMLTASILLAQIDVNGLMDYALKAGVGGAIWLCYKIVADRIDRYRKSKEAPKQP